MDTGLFVGINQKVEVVFVDKAFVYRLLGPDVPRSQWRRGRVVKLYSGKDGIACTADVNTTGGIFKRPTSKLALLDVSDE